MIRPQAGIVGQQRFDLTLELAARDQGHDEAERLHQAPNLVRQLRPDPHQPGPRRYQRARQHAVEALDADYLVEPDLGKVGQAIGVVGIRLVRRHVERGLGMARIDADRRQTLRAQGMEEPDGQRPGLEYHPLGCRRTLADQRRNRLRIRRTLAAPNALAPAANGYRRLFQRNIKPDILVHGCSPSDAWARLPVVSPFFHLIGEQPPASIS